VTKELIRRTVAVLALGLPLVACGTDQAVSPQRRTEDGPVYSA